MNAPFNRAALLGGPYELYRSLRRERPVCEVDAGGDGAEFVLTRHADVEAALCDDRFSVNRLRSRRFRTRLAELPEDLKPKHQTATMLNLDPPDHTRIRQLVSRAFTPRRVDRLAPAIKRRTDELLDDIDSGQPVELLEAFAAPLPARVIADLLGVAEADHERFRGWSERMLRTLVGAPPDLAGFREARDALERLLVSVADARRRAPRDDLVSALVNAEEDDALSNDEVIATCMLLLVAGHETTTHLIASGIWLLFSRESGGGEGQAAREFLETSETAVDELLRFESPIQGIARVTTEELELGGVRIPAGSLVSAMIGAANRDPEVFEDPDRLDLKRSPNNHLAFGKGVHFCLGATLARLEARIALTSFVERMPDLVLLDRAPRWRRSLLLRGLERLWVQQPQRSRHSPARPLHDTPA